MNKFKKMNKYKKYFTKRNLIIVSGFLGLYFFTVGASLLFFTFINPRNGTKSILSSLGNQGKSKLSMDLPKTEVCPINGALFTKPERAVWEKRRPIAVIIENHVDSRPPSGLSKTDIVYEAIAEGGITRFMGILYCGVAFGDVQMAPVRSARIYFLDWASEYGDNPIFMHVGGANDYSHSGDTAREVRALEMLESLGWRVPGGNDFDTTYDSGFPVFWRNYERLSHTVATEHTMMISTDAAYTEAEKRGFGAKDDKDVLWSENYISWKFVDDVPLAVPKAGDISFGFWDNKPDYNVEWKYDGTKNEYLRFNDGKPYTDLEFNNEQLTTKNVVVMLMKVRDTIDRNFHTVYQTTGTGKVFVFQNGNVVEGVWKKQSRIDRTRFYSQDGQEISFVKGRVWFEAVPSENTISY